MPALNNGSRSWSFPLTSVSWKRSVISWLSKGCCQGVLPTDTHTPCRLSSFSANPCPPGTALWPGRFCICRCVTLVRGGGCLMANHVCCCPGAGEDPAVPSSGVSQSSLFQIFAQKKCYSRSSPIPKLANKEQIQCIPRIRQSFLAVVLIKSRQQ